MKDLHIIVGLCIDQILPVVNYAFPRKSEVERSVRQLSISGVSTSLRRFFQKPSQLNKIVLKQVEEKCQD